MQFKFRRMSVARLDEAGNPQKAPNTPAGTHEIASKVDVCASSWQKDIFQRFPEYSDGIRIRAAT